MQLTNQKLILILSFLLLYQKTSGRILFPKTQSTEDFEAHSTFDEQPPISSEQSFKLNDHIVPPLQEPPSTFNFHVGGSLNEESGSRNLQGAETHCQEAELWVRYARTQRASSKIEVKDHRVRRMDKSQIAVGTYTDNNSRKQCFIALLNTFGEIVDSANMKNTQPTSVNKYESECLSLVINQDEDEIVTVGYYQGAGTTLARRILIIKSFLPNNPGSASNDLFSSTVVRTLSSTSDQVANSVDMTFDGAVYITGFISGFTRATSVSNKDCFIMRLDYKLNIVYLKSFGDANDYNEDCRSIKVTRSNDYIYIGGQRDNTASGRNEIFFVKLTALGDSFATTTQLLSYSDTVSLRRILLTQNKSYAGTNDQNELYFCGYTSANKGDFFFGRLDNTFTFKAVYRYGSTETEKGADCSLSLDSSYLVGIFSTNFHKPRGVVTPPIASYVDTTLSDIDLVSPFESCTDIYDAASTNQGQGLGGGTKIVGFQDVDGYLGNVSCKVMDVQKKIESYFPGGVIPSTTTSSSDYCLSTYQDSYIKYFDAQANVYSWTTCQGSFVDFTNAECSKSFSFRFSKCDDPTATTTVTLPNFSNVMTTVTGFPITAQKNTDYFQCQQAWDFKYGGVPYPLPSFSTGGATFIADMWTNLMTTYTKANWYPHTFCSKAAVTGQKDSFYFVFEQDCKDDPKNLDDKTITQDWFVIKIKTSLMDGTLTDPIVENAAYFGDRTGDEIPSSVYVDDYGFITIHGNSDATVFGGSNSASSEQVWLYAKTHWELHFEMQVLSGTYTPQFSFLSKRFIKPKFFQNNAAKNLQFLYLFPATSTGTISFYQPRPINEPINGSPYENLTVAFTLVHEYKNDWVTDNSVQQIIFGKAQFSMNDQLNYKVHRGIRFSLSTPVFCSSTLNVVTKDFATNIGNLIAGATGTYTTADDSSHLVFDGTVTASENTYYPYLWAFSNSMLSTTAQFKCPYENFWNYQNNNLYPQLMRFQQANLLHFIVDDRFQKPPEVKQNIPDFSLLVGKRNNSDSLLATSTVYEPFQHPCSIYYMKQSRFTDPIYSSFTSKNLPTWASFHESNGTLTMYPDKVTGDDPISLELYCCNDISECAVNSLLLNVYDTDPQISTNMIPSEIVLNVDQGVGQCFSLGFTQDMIWDPDQVQDATDIYSHQSHTIQIDKTSNNNGISQVSKVGMFFGQGFDSSSVNSNLGQNTVTYSYQDRYGSNQVFTGNTLSVYVNQVPQSTSAGLNYIFANQEPISQQLPTSSYFDSFFPFLAREKPTTSATLSVSLPTWFTDPDSSTADLSYILTSSDGSERPPSGFYVDSSNNLIVTKEFNSSSEVRWVKITAVDAWGASARIFKNILVNNVPKTKGNGQDIVLVGLGKKVLIKAIEDYFLDLDGDRLVLTMRQKDEIELQTYGLSLQSETGTITGRALFSGTLNMLQLKATDTHGAFAYFLLTIKIEDEKPQRRLSLPLPDQIIYQDAPFYFSLSDTHFYGRSPGPLIFFATDEFDQPLPSWIEFDPANRAFYGLAPEKLGSIVVNLRVMEQKTHDSIPGKFTIRIVEPPYPRVEVSLGPKDLIVELGDFFEETLFPNAFYDLSGPYDFLLTTSDKHQSVPPWISFNQANYTISGLAPLTPGVFHFNLLCKVSHSRATGTNFKVTVVPRQPPYRPLTLWVLSVMSLGSLLVFMIAIFNYAFRYTKKGKSDKMAAALRRFGRHKDIDLKYYQQEGKEREKAGVFVQVDQHVSQTINTRFEPLKVNRDIAFVYNSRAEMYRSVDTPRQ